MRLNVKYNVAIFQSEISNIYPSGRFSKIYQFERKNQNLRITLPRRFTQVSLTFYIKNPIIFFLIYHLMFGLMVCIIFNEIYSIICMNSYQKHVLHLDQGSNCKRCLYSLSKGKKPSENGNNWLKDQEMNKTIKSSIIKFCLLSRSR